MIDVKKSAPRPPGAKMLVAESGRIAGSVSGGCVEGAVVEVADAVLGQMADLDTVIDDWASTQVPGIAAVAAGSVER
jgi:xanthine/CO dehydrogenase XdhC/CoxF family maturation factor